MEGTEKMSKPVFGSGIVKQKAQQSGWLSFLMLFSPGWFGQVPMPGWHQKEALTI